METNYTTLKLFIISILTFLVSVLSAQKAELNINLEKFYQAEEAMEFGNLPKALKLYTELYARDTSNFNILFQIGLIELETNQDKRVAIPILEKCINNLSGEYIGDVNNKTAPSDVLYYLGTAYHLDYQLEKALDMLNRFKMILSTKYEVQLIAKVDKKINEIENAMELTKNPVEIEVENLGSKINSKYPDYSPAISADEKTLIFTSRRKGSTGGMKTKDGQYYEDIYLSKKKRGKWRAAKKIKSINTKGNEASISLSPDGSLLFVYRDEIIKKHLIKRHDGNIWTSTKFNDKWAKLTKLPENINTKSWETHASVTADGNTMFFVSNKKKGLGGRDIYKSNKLPGGQWSEPENLGATINTKYEEEAPFVLPDGKTLYFSSQAHNSMGGFDIFKSVFDDAKKTWSAPVNIGYPLNTTADDLFFTLSADGKRAYYASSNHSEGYGDKDIYVIYLKGEKKKCPVLLKGNLATQNKNLLNNTQVTVYTNDDELYGEYCPNTITGRYVIVLESNSEYKMTYTLSDIESEKVAVSISDSTCFLEPDEQAAVPFKLDVALLDKLKDEDLSSSLTPNILGYLSFESSNLATEEKHFQEELIRKNQPEPQLAFKNLHFDYKNANLSEESKIVLNKLDSILKQNPLVRISINGHTDNLGTKQKNLSLSLYRAQSIAKHLVSKGIDKNRLVVNAFGEDEPIAKNENADGADNPKGRQINRRVEIVFLNSENTQTIVPKIWGEEAIILSDSVDVCEGSQFKSMDINYTATSNNDNSKKLTSSIKEQQTESKNMQLLINKDFEKTKIEIKKLNELKNLWTSLSN